MNLPRTFRRLLLVAVTAVLLIGAGCDGYGIFANIAISEKIIDGSLPEGTSPSAVHEISDYAYISAGPKLFVKDKLTDSNWRAVELPNGYDGVQSIASTTNEILMALWRYDGGDDYEVALYYFDLDTGSSTSPDYEKISAIPSWFATSSSYSNVYIFSPDPAGPFYVNVRDFAGDVTEGSFSTSSLNTISSPVSVASTLTFVSDLSGQIITGAAASASAVRFSTSNAANTSGSVYDDTGATSAGYAYTDPVGGINYLPDVDSFIVSATDLSGDVYPVYASTDGNGDTWEQVGGNSSSWFLSFADVSSTFGSARILAGYDTRGGGSGYAEIDATDPNPSNWSFVDRALANDNNYISTTMSEVSVSAFSSLTVLGTDYLYASTRSQGLWRLDVTGTGTGNDWTEE